MNQGTITRETKTDKVSPSNPQRYSWSEQEEFRPLLLAIIEKKEREISILTETIESQKGNHSADHQENAANTFDLSENMRKKFELESFIKKNLRNAILRIDNHVYGTCRKTGRLIPKERLRLAPHATLTIEGKNIPEEKRKISRR